MSESSYAYRIPPCSKYDIAGMESWLEDMAAKGLFLDKDGLFLGFATFVRSQPEQLRFRLEATDTSGGMFSSTNDPEDGAIEMHHQMGWDYRGRWGQFHIYATADPDAPELHTDPRVQALTIQALNKFQRIELLNILEHFFILYFFHGSFFFSLTAAWGLGLTVLAVGWLLAFPVKHMIHMAQMVQLKRRLNRGIPMCHRADWKHRSWRRYTSLAADWIIGIVLVIAVLNMESANITEENHIPLEDWTSPIPFATVEDIFPEYEIRADIGLIDSDLAHWSNWIATDNYDYTEWREVVPSEGEAFNAYIQVWYYDTRFDWFAQGLARELAQQFGGTFADLLFTDREKPVAVPGVDADYAVYYDYYGKGMILCNGGIVIRVHYNHQISQLLTPEELAQIFLDHLAQGKE